MLNLEDLLLEYEKDDDNVDFEIDDILNEVDDTGKELNVEKANIILSEKKPSSKKKANLHYEEYEILIRKHIESDQIQQTEEFVVEMSSSNDEEVIEEQSLLDKIDQEERIMKKVSLQKIQLSGASLQINNLEVHALQAISNQLKALTGQACVIACSSEIVLIGTSMGEILVYTVDIGVLRYKSKVSALDCGTLIAAGYEDGKIILWDPNSRAQLKVIDNQVPLIAVKFCSDQRFLTSDTLGNTNSYRVSKVLWSYQIEIEKLLPRNIMPFYQMQSYQQYVAMTCLEYVLVIKLDPQPRILKRITRPVDELSYPCASWGQLTNTEEYTEMIELGLCVSWGTHLEVYIIDANGVKQKSSYIINQVISCSWVSRDMLIVIDKDHNLITLNAQFFNQDIITQEMRNTLREQPNYLINKSDKALQSVTQLKDVINYPIQMNTGKSLISVYSNCVVSSQRFVYMLTLPLVKRAKLLLWSDCMKGMIEKADTQQGWYDILSFGLKLYWNQLHCFALPQNSCDQRIVIADISKDICAAFMNLVGQRIEQERAPEQEKYEQWNQAIMSAIQYCIECNQQQYLFTGFKSLLTKFHRYTQFLTTLEPFILSSQIKQLPTDMLLQLSTHYKVLNKQDTVQQLILSLDPKFLDMTTIFQICQENDLYTPLIVVCPRIDNDYITPLQKMYSHFLKNSNQQMLLKCLWFMKLTFQQTLFPNAQIPQEIFVLAFSQIMMWLLLEDIFRNFAIHYPRELFEVLRISVRDPSMFNNDQLTRYFNNQKPVLVAFVHQIYSNLQQAIVTHEQLGVEFSRFVASLRGHAIREDIQLKCLKYLIGDKQNFKSIINILDQVILQPSFKSELLSSATDNYIKALFASDIFKSFDLCLEKVNRKYLHIWIQRMLAQKREQMIKVLDLYFERLLEDHMTLSLIRDVLSTLTPTEQYQLLNRQVCPGYIQLMQSLNPHQKDMRHLFIKVSCIHTPHYVLDKIHNYPLDELETIFLETKHKEGLGYIYARVGKFRMATKFFILNLLDYLEECFTKQQFQTDLLNLKFDMLFQACKDSKSHDDEDLFVEVGKELFNDDTRIRIWSLSEQVTNDNYRIMIPLLQTINNRLCEYYNYLTVDQLIELIESSMEIFCMLWIKWSFKSLLYNCRLDLHIQYRGCEIELQTFLDLKEAVFRENAGSPEYQNVCNQCEQFIVETGTHVLIRRCSHSTHQSCLVLPFCHICNPKIKMQLDSVLANRKQEEGVDVKKREQFIKESQQMKIQRKLEEEMEELQLTAEDIRVHEEQRVMHDLDLFDRYFNS